MLPLLAFSLLLLSHTGPQPYAAPQSAPTQSAPTQSGGDARTRQALAEDQALLLRQLKRLRSTMELLAQRMDAEGRTHAAKLLRQGIVHLEERRAEYGNRTLEELMEASQKGIDTGASVQALDAQMQVVKSLERLYEILTDRAGMDNLEKALKDLKQISADLAQLAKDEARIVEQAQAQQERMQSPEQRELLTRLESARERQRALQERTEALARENRALDLEQLAAELAQLRKDQATDANVAKSFSPQENRALAPLQEPLQRAVESSARAERLERAAQELRGAAQDLRGSERSCSAASSRSPPRRSSPTTRGTSPAGSWSGTRST